MKYEVIGSNCQRPEDLKNKEEYCWRTEIDVADRIVQTSRSVFNLAKKKLGIQVEEDNATQKCQYYLCILRQLHMLSASDYPAYESIKEWAMHNVIYFQALNLFEQLDKCNSGLINSTIQEAIFSADRIDADVGNSEEIQKGEQSTCEIATQFIDCLSRQKECPVFEFP